MKKYLFICENPFQIMVALIMKYQMYANSIADIIVTDRASGMENRYYNLKKIKQFRNVMYVTTKKCYIKEKKYLFYFNQMKCMFCGCNLLIINELPYDYDEIFALGVTCIVNAITRKMQSLNQEPKVNLVDEGFGCYTEHYRKYLFGFHKGRHILQAFSKLLNSKKSALSLVQSLYLFQPEMCLWNPPFEITKIHEPDFKTYPALKDIINHVFDYHNQCKDYDKPFLFFEDCTYQDTGDNIDFEIVMSLAKSIGKNNMIVKLHPRTQVNRFEPLGIAVNNKKGVPWEVIAMNMEDGDKRIFMTISSSSVITYRLLFKKSFKSMLLFKCIEREKLQVDNSLINFLENFAEKFPDDLYIPNNLEEAKEKISEWEMGGLKS